MRRRSVRSGSARPEPGSILQLVPRPSQVGQAPKGIVEGKQPRLDLRNGEAGDRAGEFFRKQHALMRTICWRPPVRFFRPRLVGEFGNGDAVGERQRGLQAESARRRVQCRAHDHAVDHHVDVVLEFLVEPGASAISWKAPSILTR